MRLFVALMPSNVAGATRDSNWQQRKRASNAFRRDRLPLPGFLIAMFIAKRRLVDSIGILPRCETDWREAFYSCANLDRIGSLASVPGHRTSGNTPRRFFATLVQMRVETVLES